MYLKDTGGKVLGLWNSTQAVKRPGECQGPSHEARRVRIGYTTWTVKNVKKGNVGSWKHRIGPRSLSGTRNLLKCHFLFSKGTIISTSYATGAAKLGTKQKLIILCSSVWHPSHLQHQSVSTWQFCWCPFKGVKWPFQRRIVTSK